MFITFLFNLDIRLFILTIGTDMFLHLKQNMLVTAQLHERTFIMKREWEKEINQLDFLSLSICQLYLKFMKVCKNTISFALQNLYDKTRQLPYCLNFRFISATFQYANGFAPSLQGQSLKIWVMIFTRAHIYKGGDQIG